MSGSKHFLHLQMASLLLLLYTLKTLRKYLLYARSRREELEVVAVVADLKSQNLASPHYSDPRAEVDPHASILEHHLLVPSLLKKTT